MEQGAIVSYQELILTTLWPFSRQQLKTNFSVSQLGIIQIYVVLAPLNVKSAISDWSKVMLSSLRLPLIHCFLATKLSENYSTLGLNINYSF